MSIASSYRAAFKNHSPNKKTIAAMEDANNGKVECYDSLESMWANLDSCQKNQPLR